MLSTALAVLLVLLAALARTADAGCHDWCPKNTNPWKIKCTWKTTCNSCPSCSDGGGPPKHDDDDDDDDDRRGGGPPKHDDDDDDDRRRPMKDDDDHRKCKSTCSALPDNWPQKCKTSACSGCPECFPKKPIGSYPACTAHSQCKGLQFCATGCATGACGVDGIIPRGRAGQFCQPCVECKGGDDSITRSCKVCPGGNSLVQPDPKQVGMYAACTSHSDCTLNQFCGTQCETGGCGAGRGVKRSSHHEAIKCRNSNCKGNFCQPCKNCRAGFLSVTGSCGVCKVAIVCRLDSDCASGHYCSSNKQCVKYHQQYCYVNACGVGDADCDSSDELGCAPGLTCGFNNCGKFHKLGPETGISASSDCCEGCFADRDCAHGMYCASDKTCRRADSEYCHNNECGLGDGHCTIDDRHGCAKGLQCGYGNCGKFHELNAFTGFTAHHSCCDLTCKSDDDCDQGHYCTARKVCTKYKAQQCHDHECGMGDGDCDKDTDAVGCAPGLICGFNNCAKFHSLVPATGFTSSSDCCEGCFSDRDCPHGSYCTSQHTCVCPGPNYCNDHECGVGDAECHVDDKKGCGKGLQCGFHNCAQYHDIGFYTGITEHSNCCEELCKSDDDCDKGHYCTSRKVCAKYTGGHCHHHECGMGDGDCDAGTDHVGCADGLVCGFNNCHKFHELTPQTGFTPSSDCCEGCFSDRDCPGGSYCTSKNVCAYPTPTYCRDRACGVGDAGCNDKYDKPGCDKGLACGVDNCAQFHAIGFSTGISADSDCCEARCGGDGDCPKGMYCTTEKTCVKPTKDFCDNQECGFGDAGCSDSDCVGCSDGLTCGFNNCGKFHHLGADTGLTASSDCCEGCFSDRDCPHHEYCTDKKICTPRSGRASGCNTDHDCGDGFYCSSRKKCQSYREDFCFTNWCGIGDGDCDPNNPHSCAPGLKCGYNNCKMFHKTGYQTGMPATADCCYLPKKSMQMGKEANVQEVSAAAGSHLDDTQVDSAPALFGPAALAISMGLVFV